MVADTLVVVEQRRGDWGGWGWGVGEENKLAIKLYLHAENFKLEF